MLEEPLPHDIHDYALRLEQALVTFEGDPDVPQKNKETILEYVHFSAVRRLSIFISFKFKELFKT